MAGEVMIIAATLGAIAAAAMTSKVKPIRSRLNTKAIAGARVDELLQNANVRAFLKVLRHGETSASNDSAYRTITGGAKFAAPPWKRPAGKAAAGAYQFQDAPWSDVSADLKLSDFSPLNQDRAAVGFIAYHGALQDVVSGNTRNAYMILHGRNAWPSLPGGVECKVFKKMASGGEILAPEVAADFVFAKWGGRATGK